MLKKLPSVQDHFITPSLLVQTITSPRIGNFRLPQAMDLKGKGLECGSENESHWDTISENGGGEFWGPKYHNPENFLRKTLPHQATNKRMDLIENSKDGMRLKSSMKPRRRRRRGEERSWNQVMIQRWKSKQCREPRLWEPSQKAATSDSRSTTLGDATCR